MRTSLTTDKIRSLISKTEIFIILFILLLFTIPLSFLQSKRVLGRASDTALIYQLVENTATRGVPYTQANSSARAARPLWTMPPQEICDSPLTPPAQREVNQLELHTYFFLYLIAPLNWFIPVEILIPTLTVLSFLLMLGITYFMLRERNVSIIGAILFCLLVSVHPAWSDGLFGQPYVDRFFMPLGILFVFLLTREKTNLWAILLVGILSCLIIERIGIILGAFTLAYAWLNSSQPRNRRIIFSIMAFAFIGYSFVMVKYWVVNEDNTNLMGQILDPYYLINRFQSLAFQQRIYPFLLFNLFFLGIFSLIDPRLLLLVLVVIAPNIIGNIGGAELTGWFTHYHSHYFPLLVGVSALGFAQLSNQLYQKQQSWILYLATTFLIILSASAYPYQIDSNQKRFSLAYLQENAWLKSSQMLTDYYRQGEDSYLGWQINFHQQLQAAIPENSIITSIEDYYPSLYTKREIHYYPLAIDTADYAILGLEWNPDSGTLLYRGAVSYLGPQAQRELDQCLNTRLAKAGYDLNNPILIGLNTAILKRYDNRAEIPPAGGLLINPGFEEMSHGQPTGWLANNSPSIDLSGTQSHTGQAAIQLKGDNNAYYQTVAVAAGVRYIFGYHARTDQDEQFARLQIDWLNDQGQLLASDTKDVRVTARWQRYMMIAIAPPAANQAAIYAAVNDQENWVWFDDFVFRQY